MKKIVSIILTLLILISSANIGYAKHFCGDYLAKTAISLGHSDLNCGMEKQEMPVCEGTEILTEVSKNNCCKDHISKIEIDENYNGSHLDIKFNKTFFVAFTLVYINTFFEENSKANQFIDYKPPLPDKDVQVLYQTFLI